MTPRDFNWLDTVRQESATVTVPIIFNHWKEWCCWQCLCGPVRLQGRLSYITHHQQQCQKTDTGAHTVCVWQHFICIAVSFLDDHLYRCGSKEYTKYTARVGPVCHSGLHTRITFKIEVVWIDMLFCPVDIFRRRSWCSGLSTTTARANLSTTSTSTSLLTMPTSSTSGLADFAAGGRSSSSSDLSLSATHTTQPNTRVSAAWHYTIQSIPINLSTTSTSTSLLTTPTSSTSGLADFAAGGRSSSSSDLSEQPFVLWYQIDKQETSIFKFSELIKSAHIDTMLSNGRTSLLFWTK